MIAMAGRQPQCCVLCRAFAIDGDAFADQRSVVIVIAPYFIYANKQLTGDECAPATSHASSLLHNVLNVMPMKCIRN